MKSILATDLAGSLLKNNVVEKAHKEWFNIMAILLKDDSVKKFAAKPDYFRHIHAIMERYLGIKDNKLTTLFARSLFQMCWLAAVKDDSYNKEYADFLRRIKGRFRIILVTSTPKDIIDAVLKKISCADIFDNIITNKITEEPDKDKLLKCMKEKPMFYITESKNSIKTCKELGIKTIIAGWEKIQSWEKQSKNKPDYEVKSVEELKKLISRAAP